MLSKSNPLAGRDGGSLPGHALRHDLSLGRQFSHVFRKGAKKMWMGSVAQRVVRLASYPVFVLCRRSWSLSGDLLFSTVEGVRRV